jgi:hypothetical protein
VLKLAKVPVKGILPPMVKPGRDAHHVGFGDAHLDETLGEVLLEGVHLQRTGEVGAQGHHFRVGLAEFVQAGTEAAAGVLLVEYGVGDSWAS